uniref:Uncharacterized protein MANES_09G112000 n=1 Tax=Rhizophora mucronata TaxID=61149 RepID=A0A2P2KNM5_RHIMU
MFCCDIDLTSSCRTNRSNFCTVDGEVGGGRRGRRRRTTRKIPPRDKTDFQTSDRCFTRNRISEFCTPRTFFLSLQPNHTGIDTKTFFLGCFEAVACL